MSHRVAVPISVLALLVSGCFAQQPPERAPLPDVATAITTPPRCGFVDGPALGVLVDEVSPGAAADGIIQPGDVLVTVDGLALTSTTDLLTALADHSPGDPIDLVARRDGATIDLSVTLGASPQDPSRPLLGISIVTDYAEIDPSAATTRVVSSPLARMITIDDSVYLLDPEVPYIGSTDLPASDGVSLVVDGVQYRVERSDTTLSLIDGDGGRIRLSTDDTPVGLVGSVGSDLVIVAQRDEGGGQPTSLLMRIGTDGDVRWEWQPDLAGALPVVAGVSPDGRRLVVGLTADDADGLRYRLLSAIDGTRGGPAVALGDLDDGIVFGWFDDARMVVQEAESNVALYTPIDGTTEDVTLPIEATATTRLWAVGDGRQLLVDTGSTLFLADVVEGTEARPLARRCDIAFVDQPGSGD